MRLILNLLKFNLIATARIANRLSRNGAMTALQLQDTSSSRRVCSRNKTTLFTLCPPRRDQAKGHRPLHRSNVERYAFVPPMPSQAPPVRLRGVDPPTTGYRAGDQRTSSRGDRDLRPPADSLGALQPKQPGAHLQPFPSASIISFWRSLALVDVFRPARFRPARRKEGFGSPEGCWEPFLGHKCYKNKMGNR